MVEVVVKVGMTHEDALILRVPSVLVRKGLLLMCLSVGLGHRLKVKVDSINRISVLNLTWV